MPSVTNFLKCNNFVFDIFDTYISIMNGESSNISSIPCKGYYSSLNTIHMFPFKYLAFLLCLQVGFLSRTCQAMASSSVEPETCQKYKGIRFFSPSEQTNRMPSLLYTFSGSGNNWLQLLVEHAKGIRTGSVYQDKNLIQSTFQGNGHCDRSVSLVLMHTIHHFADDIEKGKISKLCLKNNITQFQKVVMLYRNPFDAIWSDFQRQASLSNNHTGVIPLSKFSSLVKRKMWWRRSKMMALSYASMLEVQYPGIEQYYSETEYMYIRYEDLLNTELREVILARLVPFLGLSSSAERIKCAFRLSDSPKVS